MELVKVIVLTVLVIVVWKWIILWIAEGHVITKAFPSLKKVLSIEPFGVELNIAIIGIGLIFSFPFHGNAAVAFGGFVFAFIATVIGSIRNEIQG
ncbi:MAG: hypothetical protein ACI8Q1_003164 [Parvicella sp.]|jgi:hypothetical protein